LTIPHVLQRDVQGKTRYIVRQQNAVPIENKPSGRFKHDRPRPVVFRQVAIIGAFPDLQMPQSQSQQRHYQQKAYAQHRKSPLKV
jgi:hypothetical protein